MAGTEVTPGPSVGMATNGGMGSVNNGSGNNNDNNNNALTASYVNHFRISACADRLAMHVRAAPKNDLVEFFNLCLSLARWTVTVKGREIERESVVLVDRMRASDSEHQNGERLKLLIDAEFDRPLSGFYFLLKGICSSGLHGSEFCQRCVDLARGIDYAIANKEVPSRAQELPLLLKRVCHMGNESFLQAPILVLMISVKNACGSGWFSDQDCKELCSLTNEILGSFCSTMNFNTEPNSSFSVISTIMSRYYPRMKIGEILAFLEVKSGYGTYVHDFQISKDMKSTPDERIRLFVAQTNDIETPSCLITPTQANFILNGKGLERRNNVFMDTGPQIPTPVYHMLKYGTNVLQAVGQFNGHYIIVIAFMSMTSTPDHSSLKDYVQPTLSSVSDSEVIEGPSRISLNCPISFRRIKVPVKGHMCKHLQCVDYENYMEINSRRPSWRCPHCNQHVCFTDIRIDQNMVKVLMEVGENVNDVIISLDGSWKAVMESDDLDDKAQDDRTISGQDETAQPESSGLANAPSDVLDLTVDDYEMDIINICETEDRKVSSTNCQSQVNMSANSNMNCRNTTDQNITAPIEDDFWSGIYLSTCRSGASSSRSESQIGGVLESTHQNLFSPITDSSLDREAVPSHGNTLVATSVPQSEISSLNSLALQQFQLGNPALNNEFGRFTPIPQLVSRMPVAIQALPAQSPASALQQGPNSNMDTMIQNTSRIASQVSGIPSVPVSRSSVPTNIERLRQFSRTLSLPLQGSSHVASSTLQQYQGTPTISLQSPNQMQSSYRVSSVLPTEHQNTSQHSAPILRTGLNPSPVLMGQSASFSRALNHQGSSQTVNSQGAGLVGNQQARAMAATQRAAQMGRPVQTSRALSPYALNIGHQTSTGVTPPMTGTDVSKDLPAEQNWRPTGRMRGSLSGRAYSEALNQFIIRPTQQAEAANRPVPSSTTLSASAELEILMANRAALAQAGNYLVTGSASTSSASGVLPERRG